MKNDEEVLTQMKKKIEKVKSTIATKNGTLTALMDRLKKEFNIEAIDEIYNRLDDIVDKSEEFRKKKQNLLTKATEKLAAYEI